MMLVALFSWWYGPGWAHQATSVGRRVNAMLETFSVRLLARTLFAPFRQISAEQVRGGFDAQMRAFGDRLFSRLFGAFIRTLFICIGLLAAFLMGVLGAVQLILWPLVPLFPIIGLVLAAIGWVPS